MLRAESPHRAGLVKSRPLDRWRETLALLCAYSEGDDFYALSDLLAKRLAGAGLPGPATLAWICANNVEKAVRQWTSDLKAASPEPTAESLQVCSAHSCPPIPGSSPSTLCKLT